MPLGVQLDLQTSTFTNSWTRGSPRTCGCLSASSASALPGGSLEMLFPGPSQAWPCQAAGQSRGGMTACGRPGLTVRARPGLQQARQGAYCMLQLASGPETLAHPPASPQALDAEGACQPGLGICTRSPLRSTEAPEPHQPQGLKTGRECTSGAPTLSSPDALQQFPWRQTGSTWHLAGGALSQAPPRSD